MNDKQNKKTDDAEMLALERMLEKAQEELDTIETEEILKGMTAEELAERGILGEEKTPIQRSEYASLLRKRGLQFADGIEYYVSDSVEDPSQIPHIHLAHLAEVQKGQVLAWKVADDKMSPNHANRLKWAEYCENADSGIIAFEDDRGLRLESTIHGKAVVIGDRLYVVSSDRDGSCTVRMSEEAMSVFADLFPPHGTGKPLGKDAVLRALAEQGIIAGIDTNAIERAIETATQSGMPLDNVPIAMGMQPSDGVNAKVEYFFSTEKLFEDFLVQPDGKVDYHRVANIPMAKSGNLLARVGMPGEGRDGFKVNGVVLKAKPGEAAVLIEGENVNKSPDGKEFYAACDGQISLNRTVLSVLRFYCVEGDVNYETGNIVFNGNVTIKGNVLAGFEIKAAGDILILKSVEAATLEAGRDIKVLGGILGCTAIKCGRDLVVHHMQNSTVEVQGDAFIISSSIQSSIYSTGSVYVRENKSSVVGGLVHALQKVEVTSIGSALGTRTQVIAGSDFLVVKKIEELRRISAFFASGIERIDTVLKPIISALRKGAQLSDDRKRNVQVISAKRKHLMKQLHVIEWKLKELDTIKCAPVDAVIKIRDVAYADVIVRIKNVTLKIETECRDVTLRLDASGKRIVQLKN